MLILYVSCEGQTKKIVQHIAKVMQQSGTDCRLVDLATLPSDFTLEGEPRILLAASVHYGKHHPLFRRFVEQHWQTLNQTWSGFLSVSLLARKVNKASATSNPYVARYLANTSWQPDQVIVCAGAVYYQQYSWMKRLLMRCIIAISGGDTSNDREYTDWERIDQLCQEWITTTGSGT